MSQKMTQIECIRFMMNFRDRMYPAMRILRRVDGTFVLTIPPTPATGR